LAGDEFGRTQNGNNNAYCQDNEISWLNWEGIADEARGITDFVRKLTMLRQAFPILRRERFLTGQWDESLEVKDLSWFNALGGEMSQDEWTDSNQRCFGMLLDGRAQATGIRRLGTDATLLVVMNAHHDVVTFTLPAVSGNDRWRCLIDTENYERDELPIFRQKSTYDVAPRSLVLFALDDRGETLRTVRQIALELSRSKQLAT
jgi:isoamylase